MSCLHNSFGEQPACSFDYAHLRFLSPLNHILSQLFSPYYCQYFIYSCQIARSTFFFFFFSTKKMSNGWGVRNIQFLWVNQKASFNRESIDQSQPRKGAFSGISIKSKMEHRKWIFFFEWQENKK